MKNTGIIKFERLHEEAEQAWYDVYEAPGIAGQRVQAVVPREDQNIGAVRRALLRAGADLPTGPATDDVLATLAGATIIGSLFLTSTSLAMSTT